MMRDLLEAAWLAGFSASGEGFNGEYPFEGDDERIKADTKKARDYGMMHIMAEANRRRVFPRSNSVSFSVRPVHSFDDCCEVRMSDPAAWGGEKTIARCVDQNMADWIAKGLNEHERLRAALRLIANIENGPDKGSAQARCDEAAAIARSALKDTAHD
jgi:hypothetical protein